jgi:hypothetical protein
MGSRDLLDEKSCSRVDVNYNHPAPTILPHLRFLLNALLKLNNFPKLERASKIAHRNFFLAISGVVIGHFINN